ncbi:MAG: hypothetical protein JWL97_4156 [Gemmatimonadales bacterium]|jgi:hypothetical protein|nr:hypothetical protein [Gemmatimonadales bacterium]
MAFHAGDRGVQCTAEHCFHHVFRGAGASSAPGPAGAGGRVVHRCSAPVSSLTSSPLNTAHTTAATCEICGVGTPAAASVSVSPRQKGSSGWMRSGRVKEYLISLVRWCANARKSSASWRRRSCQGRSSCSGVRNCEPTRSATPRSRASLFGTWWYSDIGFASSAAASPLPEPHRQRRRDRPAVARPTRGRRALPAGHLRLTRTRRDHGAHRRCTVPAPNTPAGDHLAPLPSNRRGSLLTESRSPWTPCSPDVSTSTRRNSSWRRSRSPCPARARYSSR